MDRNRVLMALVIPVDFARQVGSDRTTQVQVLVDGSDANTATIALGYAESIVRGYSQELLVKPGAAARGRAAAARPWISAPGSGSTPTWNPGSTSCPASSPSS